jgi:NAD(P)-dependent dehydrogenase (short-subunit alcohol dehydrogenase family)
MALPKREGTVDGFETQFATNVLGPFLLTGLLLPLILQASAPRVVTVSSLAHTQGGPVPVKDLNSERENKPVRAYCKTKLENVLFTRELQRRAGDR